MIFSENRYPLFRIMLKRRSVLLRSDQDKRDLDGLVAFVPPCVPRAVLNDDVVRLEMNFLSAVHFKPHLAFENDTVIDGLSRVHSRTVGLHCRSQVGDMLRKLLKTRDRID